jgi:antitoxin MazE
MVTKVQKWGNSQGLRLSKQILADSHVSVGDDVDIAVRNGVIIVTPVAQAGRKLSLRKLVAQITRDYKLEKTDWGEPIGREAW